MDQPTEESETIKMCPTCGEVWPGDYVVCANQHDEVNGEVQLIEVVREADIRQNPRAIKITKNTLEFVTELNGGAEPDEECLGAFYVFGPEEAVIMNEQEFKRVYKKLAVIPILMLEERES